MHNKYTMAPINIVIPIVNKKLLVYEIQMIYVEASIATIDIPINKFLVTNVKPNIPVTKYAPGIAYSDNLNNVAPTSVFANKEYKRYSLFN